MKYNLTIKYHHPNKASVTNQFAQQTHQVSEDDESHNYLASENHQSDVNKRCSNERQKTQSIDSDDPLSTRRETVEQSIKRRNALIQKLLNSPIDPPTSPKKIEVIRFVDVTSLPQSSQTYSKDRRQIDENPSPNRIRKNVSTPPLNVNCRSPKTVSFNQQTQSEDELSAWRSKQEEEFLTRLKQKENERLKSLADEWLLRQSKEEEKLATRMKKCKLLTEALEQALNAIKVSDSVHKSIRLTNRFSFVGEKRNFHGS